MKKGIVFSLEVLIAITILTSLFTFLSVFNIENVSPYKRFERVQMYAKDSLEVMSQITVKDLIDQFPDKVPTLVQQMEGGNIENESSVIEAIGTLWSDGYYDATYYEAARNVSKEVLSLLLPKTLNYNLTAFDGQEIYSYSPITSASTEVSKSNKIVSGFQPGQPTKGFWAKAYLEKINSKVFSSYLYFGGYLGQGNLTFFINDIPSDANITSAYMETSVDSNFTLYINNTFCGLFNKTAAGTFPVDSWNITDLSYPDCLENIKPGENNKFGINFTEPNITKKGIGGGYIKVTYETDQFSTSVTNTMRYNLPGIDGIINLYDSFYVPGTITNMTMNLDISSHEKVFVNIGNKTVYYGNESTVTDNATLSSLLGPAMNYDFLSHRTVPFRIGHYGINPVGPTYSEVVLTTSRVPPMSTEDIPNGTTTISRMDAAIAVDKIFINTILSNIGNRVGLVSYASDIPDSCPKGICWTNDVTDNSLTLINNVSGYEAASGVAQRFLCGAIHEASLKLTDPLRKKYILVMSDGSAEKETPSGCPHSGSDLCPQANYTPGNLTSQEKAAVNEAYYAYLNNITVYAVGFGENANNNLLRQISACGGGEWAASDNYEGLKEIYEKFAKKMIEKSIIYDFQPASATDVNSTLFPDSYLEFDYIPEVPAYQFGEIAMKLETPTFSLNNGCNGNVSIPEQFSVDDIRVTSYSSKVWTQSLSLRNSVNAWTPVFNLTNFGTQYIDLGDPFNIQFSPAYLKSNENNDLSLVLAKNSTEKSSQCSSNNKAFYTVRFSAIAFSNVLPKSDGSNVRVYFNRGDFNCTPEGSVVVTVGTPADNTIIDVDQLDTANNAVHNATAQLLNKLNLKGNLCQGPPGNSTNPIDIEITSDLKLETSEISNVPSLWGPIKFELRISS